MNGSQKMGYGSHQTGPRFGVGAGLCLIGAHLHDTGDARHLHRFALRAGGPRHLSTMEDRKATSTGCSSTSTAAEESPPSRTGCQHGQVIQYSRQLGYGYIRPDDVSKKLFVHYSCLVECDELEAGEVVSFESERGQPGDRHDRAINVRIVYPSETALIPASRTRKAVTTLVPRVVSRPNRLARKRATAATGPGSKAISKRSRMPDETAVLGYT